jgi:hypothetical protein
MSFGYLGETEIAIAETVYKLHTRADWAMHWIEQYGCIDGAHHKTWVLDQIARILHGTAVIAKMAKWDDGQQELRLTLGEPTSDYLQWVEDMKEGEDGPNTYDYDCGIAP